LLLEEEEEEEEEVPDLVENFDEASKNEAHWIEATSGEGDLQKLL
jgi:hypothetical protein